MDKRQIERALVRCKLLVTRSAVHRSGLRTAEDIDRNYPRFLAECHHCFKRALAILIAAMLDLEGLLAESDSNGPAQKQRQATYRYWLRLLEVTYDTFIWIASNHDRSEVAKLFKGPKFGALQKQNIRSVIKAANHFNLQPDTFAFPLDFSRFSCISDLLRMRRHPDGTLSVDFIEVKEGKVNQEIFETAKARDPDRYLRFFDRYGEKGIEQLERVFKQAQILDERLKLFGLQPGIYHEEGATRIVSQMKAGEQDHFLGRIEPLIKKARAGQYSVDMIDDCLVVAALDATAPQKYLITDYVSRCVVHSAFGNAAVTDNQDALLHALKEIEFVEWREGFNSVLCIPPLLRPLSTRSFLDLLFGRVRLHLYFDAASFIKLCAKHDVRAGFLRKRATNRLRTTQGWRRNQVPTFDGRAIGYVTGPLSAIFGHSYLDEILFNWMTPSAVVRHIKQLEGELGQIKPNQRERPSQTNLFTESDLEPA